MLSNIHSPLDIKGLSDSDMSALAAEIRKTLVERVSQNGGHLASNLGVVELTLAIHKVFDSPDDKIVFDVGHQSYVHKLLTGRADKFHTLREPNGLSGFTKRSESPHDPFGAGHSGTAISAAIGFAEAMKLRGDPHHAIAIVGDGAFTGGLNFEAMNNITPNLPLIVILNENERSISKNIGGFARYIAKIRNSKGYYKVKNRAKRIVQAIPLLGKPTFRMMKNTKQAVKEMLFSSNFFEEMGMFYLGPVNGGDYKTLCAVLEEARSIRACTVIHVKTKKGAGYPPAETDPGHYHSLPRAGQVLPKTNFSCMLGKLLVERAETDGRICAVTAAMSEGTGIECFKTAFSRRFFDVGIAEEHALVFSAGLAAAGLRPVFAVYSSFLQRGYDNILHDIALQGLPVVVCIDRAGLASRDGATHHGIFDTAFLTHVPGIRFYAPTDYAALAFSLDDSIKSGMPCFIRYPNADELRDGRLPRRAPTLRAALPPDAEVETLIITYGPQNAPACLAAAERLSNANTRAAVNILAVELLAPRPEVVGLIAPYLASPKRIAFVEEGIKIGGAMSALRQTLTERGLLTGKQSHIVAIDAEQYLSAYIKPITADDIIAALGGGI